MQRLKDRINTAHRDLFEATWTQIVMHRNEVVHHFASQPFAGLATEAELQEAMEYLHKRRVLATPMLEMLQQLSQAFAVVLKSEESLHDSAQLH
ncbi:hypothetical protein [Limnobacter sp.]|uniref:hypothetical protein n=1 Tax=Limnobacter sp. TaxID=2003368 RepID=UPI0039BD1955